MPAAPLPASPFGTCDARDAPPETISPSPAAPGSVANPPLPAAYPDAVPETPGPEPAAPTGSAPPAVYPPNPEPDPPPPGPPSPPGASPPPKPSLDPPPDPPLPQPVETPPGPLPIAVPDLPPVPPPPDPPSPPEPVPVPGPPGPPFVPSAATISWRSFSGSLKSSSACVEPIPSVRAVSCAARVDLATAESAGTKQTSFTWMCGSPSKAAFNCSANFCGFVAEPVGNPRTNRARLACVTLGEKWMLEIPEPESILAKPFSAAAASSGVPSRRSWSPETAINNPASLSDPIAVRSSLQAVSYCRAVRGWPKSYMRANFSKMLRLRTKARAAADLGFDSMTSRDGDESPASS